MSKWSTFLVFSSLILCIPDLRAQPEKAEPTEGVAQNPSGWPLPWSSMKYSVSQREVLLYNDKPTELNRQEMRFPEAVALSVPGCSGTHLLRTNKIARVDFHGHVFAYLVSGTRVLRDETGHLRDLGSVTFVMWYDDTGDGRFRKVIGTAVLPPEIPTWVRTTGATEK